MRKMGKKTLCTSIIAGIVLSNTITAFAGTWKTGTGANQSKWWYDNGNGTYTSNGWQWIDGDSNGIAECYYFNSDGYCLINTTTPDGYTVNADGAWIINGVIQTKPAETQAPVQNTPPESEGEYLSDEEAEAFIKSQGFGKIDDPGEYDDTDYGDVGIH